MDIEKIVLITRKTRLEGLVERFNTREQARFYLEHSGGDFTPYEVEHAVYTAALKTLREQLARLGKLHIIERAFLPNYLFTPQDLVVTLGVDGLVVNAAKYLDGQPLVAVNPDPAHIDGILLPFSLAQAGDAVRRVLGGEMRVRRISMAEARLADGQRLLAFNDLFVGARSHVSARYRLDWAGRQERHSSSGIIVSTGAGSTGWLSSLFNMASGMQAAFGAAPAGLAAPQLEWEAERLVFVVREPFASKFSSAGLVGGLIEAGTPLRVQSDMPEGGVIFSDGVESDFLAFNSGAEATIEVSARKTVLVV